MGNQDNVHILDPFPVIYGYILYQDATVSVRLYSNGSSSLPSNYYWWLSYTFNDGIISVLGCIDSLIKRVVKGQDQQPNTHEADAFPASIKKLHYIIITTSKYLQYWMVGNMIINSKRKGYL